MQEQEIKMTAEIVALQQMVDFLMRANVRQVQMTEDEAAAMSKAMTERWKTEGIGGFEASLSDHVTAEVAEAIDGYWSRARDYIRRTRAT
jgi:hypothetical protein